MVNATKSCVLWTVGEGGWPLSGTQTWGGPDGGGSHANLCSPKSQEDELWNHAVTPFLYTGTGELTVILDF